MTLLINVKFGSIKSELIAATPTHSLYAWLNNIGDLIRSRENFCPHKSLESGIDR